MAEAQVTDMDTGMEGTMQSNAIDTRSDEIEIDLIQLFRDILRGFWKYGWFIAALISIVGTICFFAARYQYTPYYSAYTTFTVNTVSTIGYNSTAQKKNVTNRIGSVFPYILTSDALRNLVIEDMGYADFDKFPAEISASVVKDTNLVTLQVTSRDPQIAYDTLRSVLRNYPSISDVAIGEVTLKQMDESGIPTMPANTPQSRKMAALGMLVTFLICIGAFSVQSITRRTIRTEEELTRYFNTEYLGSIPSVILKKRSKNQDLPITIDTEGIPFAFAESIRTIRHRVEREAKKYNAKVILVASALQSEGKTTTAVSNRKHNVLLIDGDLRNPSIVHALGQEPVEIGVSELLSGKCKIDEVIIPYKDRKHLVLMPTAKSIDNPTELWTGARAKEMIDLLRDKCDFVIIDAPPSAVVSDASLIARYSDGCVFVIRQDYADVNILREGMEMFTGTGCQLLGCVLNHAESGGGYGYGRYGYGRYGYGRYGYGRYGYGGYGDEEADQEADDKADEKPIEIL